ncbi:EamA family transporter [Streptomyces sp. NPDC050315]|uniref:DMT family transporter n=1 Tax=Streptomyces sp. NPDC050315 TaxID=3155039 RepID=UPI0034198B1B
MPPHARSCDTVAASSSPAPGSPSRQRSSPAGRAAAGAACGAVIWGTLGPVAAQFPPGYMLQMAELRLLIGAAALYFLARRRRLHHVPWQRREVMAVALGSVAVAGFSVSYFYAVELSGVATSTVIAIGGAPVLAGLTARFITRRHVTRTWAVATAVAVAGIALVSLPGGKIAFSLPGTALAVLAAALYAAQADTIQAVARRHGPTTAVAVIFGGGALALSPWLPSAVPWVATDTGRLAGILYLGVFTTAVAYALFAHGVDRLGAPTAVTISLLEPATAAALAAVWLHQSLSLPRWAGLVLVLGGLALMMRRQQPGPGSA